MELIHHFFLRRLTFAGPTAPRSLWALVMRLDMVVDLMIAPRCRGSPAPAWTASFILGNRALGIGFAGKRAALDMSDMGGERLGLSGLRLAMRLLMLLGQLGGIQGYKPDGGQGHVTLLVFHLHLAYDAAPIPPPGLIPLALGGTLEQQRQRH